MSALRRLSMKLSRRPRPSQSGDPMVEDTSNADYKPKVDLAVERDVDKEAVAVDGTQLFITEAEVTGVTERVTKGKKYVFRIKLNWSDGSVSHSYRGYTDFFHFQCRLLDLFPEEAGEDPAKGRIIPYLPGRSLFKRSDLKLAQDRLPEIHEYIVQLFKLPRHIVRSQHVLEFFKSNWVEDTAIAENRGDHQKHYEQQQRTYSPVNIAENSDCVHFTNPHPEAKVDESIQFECTEPQLFTTQPVDNVQEIV